MVGWNNPLLIGQRTDGMAGIGQDCLGGSRKRYNRPHTKLRVIAPPCSVCELPTIPSNSQLHQTRFPIHKTRDLFKTPDPQTSLQLASFCSHRPGLNSMRPHCQPAHTGANDLERQGQQSTSTKASDCGK